MTPKDSEVDCRDHLHPRAAVVFRTANIAGARRVDQVRRITGLDFADPEFKTRFSDQLRRIVRPFAERGTAE